MMLQRTRAENVAKVFVEFIRRFPTPEALCTAEEYEIRRYFRRLGLVRRADRVRQAVCTVLSRYGGEIPCDLDELQSIPGIGSYVAAVLLSIVCRAYEPFIDSNVVRVFSRVLSIYESRELMNVIKRVLKEVPQDIAPEVNIALIDLGALVCTPRRPACDVCPLNNCCSTYKALRKSNIAESQ